MFRDPSAGNAPAPHGILESILAGASRSATPPGLTRLLGIVMLHLALSAQVSAAVSITLAGGVTNPPTSLDSTGLNPKQTAVAQTAALVPVATFAPVLQSVLNAQGFTVANHWTVSNNTVTLNENATFNITAYNLFLNGGGTAFGQTMDFTLNPNLASPAVPGGSTATLHWLQYVNTKDKVNGYGFTVAGQQGFWQADNGQVNGGAAAGAATGPYYDSNSNPGDFSVPPTFHDAAQFYSGVGTYLYFTAIPVWDVFTPAAGETPAASTIHVANYGVSWGFHIIPEPEGMFVFLGFMFVALHSLRRRRDT